MRIYYAHVMALYNTPQEQRDVETLKRLGFDVLNPNGPQHQKGAKKDGMAYFESVVLSCDALAFRALPDGKISSGVAQEIQWAQKAKMPIIELPGSFLQRFLTYPQTVEYLLDTGER